MLDVRIVNQPTPNAVTLVDSDIRLTTPEEFLQFVKSDALARRIVKVFGGDNTDFISIIALVYPNVMHKTLYKQLFRSYDFPQLNGYLKRFKEHTLELPELVEIGTRILRFDRNDIIGSTLKYKAREYRRKALGAEPTQKDLAHLIRVIEQEIEHLKKLDEENPMIGFLETFLKDSRELLEMWTKHQLAAKKEKKIRR
jgi:hypothetical protein